jgi:hypothetical protein
MGSTIELNDTLQITHVQGFPRELNFETHLQRPFRAEDFSGREFEFYGKRGLRVYKAPPVRNFLVENVGGRWLYWGLVHITELRLDYQRGTTSGKFRIIYLYSPDEMRQAHELIDRNPETAFFSEAT